MSEPAAQYNVGESITDELAQYGDQFDDLIQNTCTEALEGTDNSAFVAQYNAYLLLAGRAAAQAIASQWVSVNDRLPEPGREVPISVLDTVSNVERRYLSCGAWSPNDYEGYWTGYRHVTHWLDVRLPPIPASQESGE
jgi:hypothetical protein